MGRKKSQTVGYRYFVGVHFVLCHGPIDRILQIKVDDKVLWTPLHDQQGVGQIGGYETITVDAPGLFGGEDREGGVSGELDVGFGDRTQGKNGYLQQVLQGKLLPAYRGVVSVILRKMYVGTNPYLKPWKFRVQRIWAPTATNKPQWSPPNAGIGLPGDQYVLRDVFGPYYGLFGSASTMFDGRLYTVRNKRVNAEDTGAAIGANTPSGITLVVHDYNTGKVTIVDDVPRKAPYVGFHIRPMTDDVITIDGGRKLLYPLCVDRTNSQFKYHYAAIFDVVDRTVTRIQYPASPLMANNRNFVYPSGLSAAQRSYLGVRFAAAWDDDIDGHYIVLGPQGSSYKLIPLRGEVVQLYNDSLVPANGYRLGYQKAPQRRLFVFWYTRFDIQGVWRDQLNAAIHDTETGMVIWESGPTLIPGGAFKFDNFTRVSNLADISIMCAPDGFVYVFLSRTMAAYFGKRVLVYNTISPPGSSPELTDMGLPWYKYTGIDGYTVETSWYQGHACGTFKQPRTGLDGQLYGFSAFSTEPGFILNPGMGPGLSRGSVSLMPWNGNGSVDLSHGATVDSAVFVWHGLPVAITPRWIGSTAEFETLTPLVSPDNGVATTISPGPWDMNPIHIIRECMTNTEWGRGLPDSIIGPSYAKAAQTIYKEGLGLSMLWTSEMAVNDFILEVIRHIDAVRYEDPETGLQEIKLIRPDYDVATLPVLSPSNCRIEQLTAPTLYDLVNQITIEFWNRDTGEDSALAIQDTAAINMSGTVNNQTMQYAGICSERVALLVGQRDLARYSKPFRQGRLIVNRKVANIKPGDPFILNWPARGVTQMVCRAAKRSDNGELDGMIGIEFGEDIFSAPYNVANVPPPSGWEDPIKPPVNFDYVTMFDLPYPLLVEELGETEIAAVPAAAGYAGFAGGRPLTGSHMNYGLFLYAAGSTPPTDSQVELVNSFTPVAVLGEAIQEITDPVITVAVSPTTDMVNVRAGDWVIVGTAADPVREMMCVAEDPGASPVALKLTRAVADTYPRAVPAGTPLFVVGTFFGTDQVERVDGEDVAGYGRPKNGKGSYAGPYTYLEAEMVARQGRPYPAASFKVDGVFTPSLSEDKKVVELTWAHRHRVQQSNQAVSWLASGNVGPETGVTYQVQQVALDEQQAKISDLPVLQVGAVDHLALDLMDQPYPDAARYARISVEAVRGGIVSLQNRPVTVKLAPRLFAPTDLRAEYVPLPRLVAPDHLRADYLPGSAPLLAPNSLRADYVSGKVALLAPDHLSAVFDSGKVELVAPDQLRAVYTGPGKLVAPDHLVAQYVGQAKLAAPDHLVARYVPASAPLYEPNGLRAIYVGPGKLAAPDNLVARYVGQGKLVAPSGLRASFVPATAPLYEPSSLQAVYVGPGKLVAPDHLAAQYVGLVKLLAPTGLTAEFVPATPPFYEPSDLRAQYVGLAKLVAPSDLAAQYEGVHVLNSPDMLRADYLGIPKLAAPTGLKADYI